MRFTWLATALIAAACLFVGCDDEDSGGSSGGGGGGSGGVGLSITTTTLPNCPYATDYLQTLAATGGTAPYTWDVVSGTLPGNIELTIAGEVAGHPSSVQGTFHFRVRVTDQLAATAERDLTLIVDAPTSPYYGEPAAARYVFVIDASAESATVDTGKTASRLERAIVDVNLQLAGFSVHDRVEVLAYGTGGLSRCLGSVQYYTPGIQALVSAFLGSLTSGGSASMYGALEAACTGYGTDLDWIGLYAGAEPGADAAAPGGTASYTNILTDFPTMYAVQTTATLGCNNLIPAGSTAGTTSPSTFAGFMQNLAALAGGSYFITP